MSSAAVGKLKKKAAEFEQKKQFDKALSLYVQVLEELGRDLDDTDLQVFNRVGDLLMRQGNVSEALSYYEKAVDVYAERGFLNNAIALCNKILRQSPARSAVYYKLGKISASKGFKSDAKKNFLEYADRMQKSGHVDEAFRALKEFADLCPDQDDIRLMLADQLQRENRKGEALEQLETLYTKLEAEGRDAEARATIDRIKAIDPNVVPRPSGTWVTEKSNDLVFLDLAADETPNTRRRDREAVELSAPPTPTPVLVHRVPALEGLALTSIPDDGDQALPAQSLLGFESTNAGMRTLDEDEPENVPMRDLVAGESATVADVAGVASLLEGDAESWTIADEPVPKLQGFESPRVSLSGAHPTLAPLIDEPPMTGNEFASLALREDAIAGQRSAHDLALPSDLPLLASDDPPVDLLRVRATPLDASLISPVSNEVPNAPGSIDLLALPPVGAFGGGASSIAEVVTGSASPLDIPVLEGFHAAELASLLSMREKVTASPSNREEPELASARADATPSERDTSEVLASDDVARGTDEILVVHVEPIDDPTARAPRRELTLHGEETPDAWIEAALGSRDDFSMDRFLTPLGVPTLVPVARDDGPIAGGAADVRATFAPALGDADAVSDDGGHSLTGDHRAIEVADLPWSLSRPHETATTEDVRPCASGDETGAAADGWSPDAAVAATQDAPQDALQDAPQDAPQVAALDVEEDLALDAVVVAEIQADAGVSTASGPIAGAARGAIESAGDAEVAEPNEYLVTSLCDGSDTALSGADAALPHAGVGEPLERDNEADFASANGPEWQGSDLSHEINLLDELTPPFMRKSADEGMGESTPAATPELEGLGECELSELVAAASIVDVDSLREAVEARDARRRPTSIGVTLDDAQIESVFRERAVELPLLDVDDLVAPRYEVCAEGPALVGSVIPVEEFLVDSSSFDEEGAQDLVSQPPLEPATLTPDEWPSDMAPEVLIDGEWRDEHVGGLVSGEVGAIRPPKNASAGHNAPRFDDLAAAMMWPPADIADIDGTPRRYSTPLSSDGIAPDTHSFRSTLSFGGEEAQLRRRLELDPGNLSLRRLLGEALLDKGAREQGLHELDVAMRGFEQLGDLEGARSVADVVLRIIPTSVRHHQKRVEYAVRSNDRVRLVEAYVELADALFRSGEEEKARVVYSRVLDLAPSNEPARFALGLLVPDTHAQLLADASTFATRAAGESMVSLFDRSRAERSREGPASISSEIPTIVEFGTSVAVEPLVLSDENSFAALRGDLSEIPGISERVRFALPGDDAGDDAGDKALRDDEVVARFPEPSLDAEIDAAFAEPPVVEGAGSTSTAPHESDKGATDSRVTPAIGAAALLTPVSQPVTPARPVIPPTPVSLPAAGHDDDFVDLGSWLRGDEVERSTRMVTTDAAPSGDEQADFNDMLRRFKQGVAENVEEEDYASHYDLGVAFKEMGLIDEAIAQFQKALRGDSHRVRSYEALGQCFVEKGQLQVAVTLLKRSLETSRADDQQLVGVLYLLGYASEVMARHADALGYYQRVFAVDIEFRDVAQRVAAMEHQIQ